jgi:N-acetylmuramoyl-L-alanine amidase
MKQIILSAFVLLATTLFAQKDSTQYWLGKSTGKLPAISFGLGDDRLGGTKMGYIDTNVTIKVIDSVQNMYAIQLSKLHSAFIEKIYVKKDFLLKEKPFSLTGSIMAKGTDTCYDIVSISLDEKLPYRSWMEIDPSKIMIDIFGVQANTNWITQLSSLKEIKNIYYNQVEDDVVRVTIELKHQQHWGYSIGYKNKILQLKVKRQPPILDIKKLKIAIDAGHGGTNLGTDGVKTKASEKEYTLKFAKALSSTLKKKGIANIVMTRTNDTTFDNKDRILFLQQENPDFLISLHLNSSNNKEVSGSSTYYKHIGFRPLSQTILRRMFEIKLNEFGNVGNFNFVLNAPTDFVNTLLEVAFLSNEADEKRVIDPKFPNKLALQIYKGMIDWLNDVKKQKLQ